MNNFIDSQISNEIAEFRSAGARLIATTPGAPSVLAETTRGIAPGGASPHPAETNAVQALQSLLLDRFHPHRPDVSAAYRFEQRTGIGGVGLVR